MMDDFWTRTRQGNKYLPTATITLLVKENPKLIGSKAHERFSLYRNGMTVEEAYRAGLLVEDLDWDIKHNFVVIQ